MKNWKFACQKRAGNILVVLSWQLHQPQDKGHFFITIRKYELLWLRSSLARSLYVIYELLVKSPWLPWNPAFSDAFLLISTMFTSETEQLSVRENKAPSPR